MASIPPPSGYYQCIEGLRKLVDGDQPYSPKIPYSKEISELEPAPMPEPGTPEWLDLEADIAWMREACGTGTETCKGQLMAPVDY